jgi:hypothetical protein
MICLNHPSVYGMTGLRKPMAFERIMLQFSFVMYLRSNFIFRFGLCDQFRRGDRVVISPNRNLSVVSDNVGRVTLIDNLKGVAIRMWKGML